MIGLLLLSTLPLSEPVTDRVDVIELNRFYDGHARLVFDQLIFYQWNEQAGDHQVVAWRMLKSNHQKPRKNYYTGEWIAEWHDTQKGDCYRRVIAREYRVRHTQYDIELRERDNLPMDKRQELSLRRK